MRNYGIKISALFIVVFLWLCVVVLGRGRYEFNGNFPGTINVEGVATITGNGDGGLTNYDLLVGDTATPSYGMMCIGQGVLGITNFNAAGVDLDGTFIFRNLEGPTTGLIEFLWEEGNGSTRFALPVSGVGNATFNPRSMFVIGPDPTPADSNVVTVGYWQGQGYFHNLICDTVGSGAEFGVQGNAEFEEKIYCNFFKESTPGAGVTIDSNTIVSGILTVNGDQSGAADHVFDDYDDIELLRKWRQGKDLPFDRGDILNRDRLLRDAIIQQQKQIDELVKILKNKE